jgi:hypothetical protein
LRDMLFSISGISRPTRLSHSEERRFRKRSFGWPITAA